MRFYCCSKAVSSSVAVPVLAFGFAFFLGLHLTTSPLAAAPPSGIPVGAEKMKFSSADGWAFENQLLIVVNEPKADNVVRIPRLANVVKSVAWKTGSDAPMQVQPEPTEWLIKPGAAPADQPGILVLTLDGPPVIFDESVVAVPDANQHVLLPAKYAKTVGENLRFEPQPHKNTVGYWSNLKDTAHWQLKVEQSGVYEVDILQGCGKGHGGSHVQLQIENQMLSFEVQETGHFQNFLWRTLGKVTLSKADRASLALVPQSKPGGAVMDVRAIRLVPVGSERSFESELADPAALPRK